MKTQAWGWLAAGVLAAGLNASYHDGGLQWAHQVADSLEQGKTAVLALTSGQADASLTEARLLTPRNESASCPLSRTMARVQTMMERSRSGFDVMSAREERQLARLEANRARIEAQITSHNARARFAPVSIAPVEFKAIPAPVICPRVRVNLPKLPMMKMPEIHVDVLGAGPV